MVCMRAKHKTLFATMLHLAVFGLLGLLFVDTFGFPEKTNKYLGLASESLIVPVLIGVFGANILLNVRLHPRIQSLFRVALGVLLPLIGVITWYWSHMLENSIYAQFRLHPEGLLLIFLSLTGAVLLTQPVQWWNRHWRKIIVLLPLLGWTLIYIMSWWPMNYLKEVVKEDHLIEWLQFWVLFVGGVLSLVKAWLSFNSAKRNWLFILFFLGAGLVFIFVAGDEIAWGQRVLGLSVSEEVQLINRQGEYTVHNLYAVEWAVAYMYGILSGFGIVGRWIVSTIAKINTKIRFMTPFTPHYSLIPIFTLSFIFFIQQLRIMWGVWHVWSEPAELLLYLGLVLWVLLTDYPKHNHTDK